LIPLFQQIIQIDTVRAKQLTTSLTLSVVSCDDGGSGDAKVDKADPEEELVHGTRLEEGIVSVDGLGDCLEAVHVTGKADEVGGNKADDREHGGAAMTELGLAEPGKEEGVGIGKIERIVLELVAAEVNASNHVVPHSVGGDGSRTDAGLGSRSKCCGGAEDGGEDGGRLHFHCIV